MNRLRKAAVLLTSVEPELAARLLGDLSGEEQSRLRAAVDALDRVPEQEKKGVWLDFLLDRRRRGRAPGEDGSGASPQPPPSAIGMRLASLLQGLDGDAAIALLDRLDAPLRAEALVALCAAAPPATEAVHAAPREAPAERPTAAAPPADPPPGAARRDRRREERVRAEPPPSPSRTVAAHEAEGRAAPREAAEPAREPPRPQRLSDATLAPETPEETLDNFDLETLVQVLRQVEVQVAVLALAGSSRELAERVLARLPPREAQLVTYELEHLQRVRLSEVEAAVRDVFRLSRERLREHDPAVRPRAAVEWSL